MTALIVLSVIAATLFSVVFAVKRRFGLLGLSLAAGSIIASMWARDLVPFIGGLGVSLTAPPLESVIALFLTLLPSLILLLSAKKTNRMASRVWSAVAFTLLAITLLQDQLQAALVIEGMAKTVFEVLDQYESVIVAGLLGCAIFDLFGDQSAKPIKGAK